MAPEKRPLVWLFLCLSLLLVGIHLYLGLAVPAESVDHAFLLLGVCLLLVPAMSVTSRWDASLYLLQALLTCTLGVVWVLDGMDNYSIGVFTGVPAIGVIVLAAYLFLREEDALADA